MLDLHGRVLPRDRRRISRTTRSRAASSTWRGRPRRPAAIRRTALLTVEGERDDICALGQTAGRARPVHRPPPYRAHHLQAGRRALRRVQRRALGARDLPRDPQPHPEGALSGPSRGHRRGVGPAVGSGGAAVSDPRSEARAARVRDRARHVRWNVPESRRTGRPARPRPPRPLDEALAALDRGDPDADPITVIDSPWRCRRRRWWGRCVRRSGSCAGSAQSRGHVDTHRSSASGDARCDATRPEGRAQVASRSVDRAIAPLAAGQYGVVERGQLVALGLSGTTIGRRMEAGRLHRLHRGVYAVGHPLVPTRGRWLAAVLACASRRARVLARHRSVRPASLRRQAAPHRRGRSAEVGVGRHLDSRHPLHPLEALHGPGRRGGTARRGRA